VSYSVPTSPNLRSSSSSDSPLDDDVARAHLVRLVPAPTALGSGRITLACAARARRGGRISGMSVL
jgi:hypothetical protein